MCMLPVRDCLFVQPPLPLLFLGHVNLVAALAGPTAALLQQHGALVQH
jgi:hypothetical protein